MTKYSFLTEAFPSNYNRNTIGEFQFLFSGDNLKQLCDKIDNNKFRLKHISNKKSNVGSVYYISIDNTKLIRISDHWSKSNIRGVREVGYIGNCLWILNSNKLKYCKHKYQVGIIDILKLRKI